VCRQRSTRVLGKVERGPVLNGVERPFTYRLYAGQNSTKDRSLRIHQQGLAFVPGVLKNYRRLRGLGVFIDYAHAVDLPDFNQFNLVYGFNGSGKTTLSRVRQRP
jgi:hypothetical protein